MCSVLCVLIEYRTLQNRKGGLLQMSKITHKKEELAGRGDNEASTHARACHRKKIQNGSGKDRPGQKRREGDTTMPWPSVSINSEAFETLRFIKNPPAS